MELFLACAELTVSWANPCHEKGPGYFMIIFFPENLTVGTGKFPSQKTHCNGFTVFTGLLHMYIHQICLYYVNPVVCKPCVLCIKPRVPQFWVSSLFDFSFCFGSKYHKADYQYLQSYQLPISCIIGICNYAPPWMFLPLDILFEFWIEHVILCFAHVYTHILMSHNMAIFYFY